VVLQRFRGELVMLDSRGEGGGGGGGGGGGYDSGPTDYGNPQPAVAGGGGGMSGGDDLDDEIPF
jgi:single-strand DNA-binding protein